MNSLATSEGCACHDGIPSGGDPSCEQLPASVQWQLRLEIAPRSRYCFGLGHGRQQALERLRRQSTGDFRVPPQSSPGCEDRCSKHRPRGRCRQLDRFGTKVPWRCSPNDPVGDQALPGLPPLPRRGGRRAGRPRDQVASMVERTRRAPEHLDASHVEPCRCRRHRSGNGHGGVGHAPWFAYW